MGVVAYSTEMCGHCMCFMMIYERCGWNLVMLSSLLIGECTIIAAGYHLKEQSLTVQ